MSNELIEKKALELVGRLQLGDLAAIPEAVTALQSLIATAREAEALRAENARLRDTIKTFNDVAVRKGKSMISSIARAALEQGEDAILRAERNEP